MSNAKIEDEADFVIVGTGAGGATAARVLSAAGLSVLMLEEGPYLKPQERPRALVDAMALAFRDFGTATTRGTTPMPVLQGRCVGGSTAINSGIIWRMPEDVRREWVDQWGLGGLVDEREMERVYATLERELHVHETQPEISGGNNEKMALACERLGLKGKPMTRNAASCKGSGQCLQGCPNLARQSMDVSYVPRALADGARLSELMRVDRVIIHGGRAVGVEGDVLDRETKKPTGRFVVRARRAVILAASVVYTPVILRKSGLRGVVGDRFQAHPGAAVLGRFPDAVGMSFGATQGYEVPLRHRRMKLETLSLPPEMLAVRLPGAGPKWQEGLAHMDRFAQWCVQVRMEAKGRIRPSSPFARFNTGTAVDVRYEPTERDVARIREGVVLLSRMMFAAGATEVYPGIASRPHTLTDLTQVDLLEQGSVDRSDFHMVASHLFGTAVAGAEPATSVVSPSLETHDVRDLYVMDASVFPTNMGVNPQHSIMTVVWLAAERLANASRAVSAA